MRMDDAESVKGYDPQERQLAAELIERHYDDLLLVARRRRRRAKVGETMRTEDILHEGLLKLGIDSDFRGSAHVMGAATLAIRHVICDYARSKLAAKRSAARRDDSADVELLPEYGETPEQIVAIGDLMARLDDAQPRWARIADARYFMGLTEEETADLLGLSSRTVRRDWTAARSWLAERVGP